MALMLIVWLVVAFLVYAKYKSDGFPYAALWPLWVAGLILERISVSIPRRKKEVSVERWS
jgi:hypothetical protein